MSRFFVSCALIASAGFAFGQGPGGGGGGGGGCPNRGGSSGAAGMMAPQSTSTGTTTTTATTAAAALMGASSNSALASRTLQLERQLAAQQAYLQYMQQEMAQQKLQQAQAQQAAQAKSDRQNRLRRTNAEKALAAAKKAEFNGKTSVARRHYRRVVELATAEDPLTREANESLGRLESTKAPLVAANGR